MATIVQRQGKNSQPSYRAQVRRKGAPPLSATFTKLSDARKWVQVTEAAILEGRHFKTGRGDLDHGFPPAEAAILEGRHFKTAEAKRRTLADLIERYCTDVLPRKAQETAYGQALQLRWWKAQLGHYALGDVTPALLAECRDQLARDHKSSTVNGYLAALSRAFTTAVREWGWLDNSPMRKVSKPKQPRGRVRFL